MRTHLLATVLTALLLPLPDGFAEDAGTFSADDYRAVALQGGDAQRGEQVFRSQEAACAKCHAVGGDERRAGPNLSTIGDKYSQDQLITAVLEPSALIHPDFGTTVVTTTDGRVLTGVLQQRTDDEIRLLDSESQLVRVARKDVESEQRSPTSLMPADLIKTLNPQQFADLIAYLASLRQDDRSDGRFRGMPAEIPELAQSITLVPLHPESLRFDHPVWIIAHPTAPKQYLVIEQQTRTIWRLDTNNGDVQRHLFADLSGEAITGQYEGVMCLAFHPQFSTNRKYYLNYHVREGAFSPVIVERIASKDLLHDSGTASRRLLRIEQTTDLHWGGMLAFGPDGYLYIGAGDGGPQEDPDGNGQNLTTLLGKILRIDVDRTSGGLPYAIPETNPFAGSPGPERKEIYAWGYRMPWRFSFDPETHDLWVGDIGQNLFEEVNIARVGENHGWNVYEGFAEFSDQYRQPNAEYTPPVFSYRRKLGVSVTGGYVYRGKRNDSFYGAYIFGDFESKRIWALTAKDRKLEVVRQIGTSPERIASFGLDADGELLMVGYEGTIFRLVLDGVEFK